MEEINKNNPFKTPEGYFEKLTDKVIGKLSEEELDLPAEDGFVVPDNYFENFHANLQSTLNIEETKVIPLTSYRNYYLVAASIAALVLVYLGFNYTTSEDLTFENLAEADIESYFENNEYDLSTYEIAEVLPIDELEINDILTNRFDEEILIEYLDENIKDFEELNLEDYE